MSKRPDLTISIPDDDNNELIFNDALKFLKRKSQNITIRPSTIHLLIKYIMEYIEKTPIKGLEQREMSLRVLRALFVDLTEGEDEKILLKLLDDGTVANLIDLIVDVSKGKFDINTAVEVSVGCIPFLCRSRKGKKNILNGDVETIR